MTLGKFIPIVDVFAGPGGLGEGFSSIPDEAFKILVSAEMEESAHKTLQFRAFYRALKRRGDNALDGYYAYCNGSVEFADLIQNRLFKDAWLEAENEARKLTLGNAQDNDTLDSLIKAGGLEKNSRWVLIGGPPCQAYSLVGRSRNQGKKNYRPEEDHRHFLYREYLRIIQKYRPAVFVMENVKGILSSSIEGEKIFQTILHDLADPSEAEGKGPSPLGYRIHSLSHDIWYERGMDFSDIDARKFIVRSEEYGIPQARHRVILLGVREDIDSGLVSTLCRKNTRLKTVENALIGLPKLRSTISKQIESGEIWAEKVRSHFAELADAAKFRKLNDFAKSLTRNITEIKPTLTSGSLRLAVEQNKSPSRSELHRWYGSDKRLKVWLNHETRGHMSADLMRYAYASAFAAYEGRSPKGHTEFNLIDKLHPLHANWETGKFSDRFRVQLYGQPSTTITSHISKDGHYFIHPDPAQCRSLTVREAARLQTFPDNYFFLGNRTQQFHQVGNAVPPLLARKIAEIVRKIFDEF